MTNLLTKLFIPPSLDLKSPLTRKRYGNLASIVGSICNLILFLFKLALGYFSGSIAITADAFNNLSDIGSNVVTFLGFKLANQPPDDDHPFGHGRFEYISGLIIAVFVLLVGVEIVKTSISKIITPVAVEFSWLIILGLLVSIGLKLWMGLFYGKIGKTIGSTAMSAASADSRSDCISTAATAIGLVIARMFNVNIDGWLGLLVGFFILYAGYKIFNETISPLLGNPPSKELIQDVMSLMRSYPICIGIHDLIIHDYGPGRLMGSAHMEISSTSDMLAAHDEIDNAERRIRDELGLQFVIHMDPVETHCHRIAEYRELLADILVAIDPALSYHDFRMVHGATHTNLIFDIVVPYNFKMKNQEIKNIVDCALRAKGEQVFTVITFDRNYLG